MASKPGPLTDWPWQKLGNFKYLVLAPWVVHSLSLAATAAATGEWAEVDWTYMAIFPSILLRMIHNQVWISLSRFHNARSKHRIVDKGLEFDQVDREKNWDDQIILNALIFYVIYMYLPQAQNLPLWRTDGAILMALLHTGPVEFLYYWLHRALHHHYLFSRYHSHHHSSIVTEPITSVIHPFAEIVAYYILFTIPIITSILIGNGSIITVVLYLAYIDFMNNMGHCNFELVPRWFFSVFPPLKYLMYTPSYHSLHHTQFRTNYSLFMPFYDYIYHTEDKSSDELYERSQKGHEEVSDTVHLTHLTTLQSTYHISIGFAAFASNPYKSKWYMFLMLPFAWLSFALTWIYGSSFTVERNILKKMRMQTWMIPRYNFQYGLSWEKEAINDLIEAAILDADAKGVKVLSLGLLNQADELNGGGIRYLQKHPKLRLRIVDGSSLTSALVLNSIPQGTERILLCGHITKVARVIATTLCQRGIQVLMRDKQDFYMLKPQLPEDATNNLALSDKYSPQVWIVGEGLNDAEQKKASKGTKFIPFSQFPLKKLRKDCTYYTTPAMKIPNTLENVHACENWLPRRVMSAPRIAGIVHTLEGWDQHECGDKLLNIEKTWSAALAHGFLPLTQV